MSKVTTVVQIILLLQQICSASCAVTRHPVNNNPSSAAITRLHTTNSLIPFNITSLRNSTHGNYSVHDHSAYCTDDDEWYHPGDEYVNAADCEDAISDMVRENWNLDHRLYWSFPGRNDHDHEETPLKYPVGSCVLAIWPRYLATLDGDEPFREAEPAGTQHQDLASFHDLATLAYRVFEQCMVLTEEPSRGWVPAGDQNSLFVGFWGRNSPLDLWTNSLHASLTPAVAVT